MTPTQETEQWIREHGSERDALNIALAKLEQARRGQPCGHALSYIVSSGEGTSYCQKCTDDGVIEAQLWAEIERACADIASKDAALRALLIGIEGLPPLTAIEGMLEKEYKQGQAALSPAPEAKPAAWPEAVAAMAEALKSVVKYGEAYKDSDYCVLPDLEGAMMWRKAHDALAQAAALGIGQEQKP